MSEQAPNPGGRPSEYESSFARIAKEMCRMGATNHELAAAFGVTTRTIISWTHKHKAFARACMLGKKAADDRVERSLYERAVGYTFESEKVFQHEGHVVRAEIVEHVPPDVSAAAKWLHNRRPERWREKQHIDVNASGLSITMATGEEARRQEAEAKAKAERDKD
jgi:hypothetical protein